MPDNKTILLLVEDAPESKGLCSRICDYLADFYGTHRIRVVVAVWTLSHQVAASPPDLVSASGPYYPESFPNLLQEARAGWLHHIIEPLRISKITFSVRVLKNANTERVLDLVRLLRVDLLLIGKPRKPGLIDYLVPGNRVLGISLDEIIRQSPVLVLVVP